MENVRRMVTVEFVWEGDPRDGNDEFIGGLLAECDHDDFLCGTARIVKAVNMSDLTTRYER
jgi:hypothetical protein